MQITDLSPPEWNLLESYLKRDPKLWQRINFEWSSARYYLKVVIQDENPDHLKIAARLFPRWFYPCLGIDFKDIPKLLGKAFPIERAVFQFRLELGS